MSELKVGDVVQLKSGGPNMTITNISSKNNKATCQYFVPNGKSWELGLPIQAGLNALMLSLRTSTAGASEDLSINKSLGNSTAAGITTPNPFEKKLSK